MCPPLSREVAVVECVLQSHCCPADKHKGRSKLHSHFPSLATQSERRNTFPGFLQLSVLKIRQMLSS